MRKTTNIPGGKKSKVAKDDFPDFAAGEELVALSPEDKEKVARYYEQGRHRSELRALTAAERAEVKRDRIAKDRKSNGKATRPKHATNGLKVISLGVERDLLQRADAYAKRHGLKRAEFFTAALRGALSTATKRATDEIHSRRDRND